MNAISTQAVAPGQSVATRSQLGNIFGKDLRHHWREVAASLALLAGFVWVEVREWSGSGFGSDSFLMEFLKQFTGPLVPISWIFLIVRLVQGESLVGDRQFWVTRPYEWPTLAASKAFFVLAFINLPLFLADLLLLALAGFPPFRYAGGLLWLQGTWIAILILPVAGLATVTASVGQMLLAMLFVALYGIAFAALASVIPNSSFADSVSGLYLILMLLTASAVLLLQYSRRKTAHSRVLIVGLGVAVALILVATPYKTLIARAYPLTGANNPPVQLALIPSQAPAPGQALTYPNAVPIAIHLDVSGIPQDSFIELQGSVLTLTNSQGGHWDSRWEPFRMLLFPDHKSAKLTYFLNPQDFERMKPSPVNARLTLPFAVYRDTNQRPFVVPTEEFAFENFGICTARSVQSGNLGCRAPLHGPARLLVTGNASASTCPNIPGNTSPNNGGIGRQFLQNGAPAELGLSPVRDFQISLSDWSNRNTQNPYNGICPGTPVTLSTPEEISRGRIELEFDNLSLADYQESSVPRPID